MQTYNGKTCRYTEEKLGDVTKVAYLPRPHTLRCRQPLSKVVIWGGVTDVVNHAKFHQNRFRGFGSAVEIYHFPTFRAYSAMAYITG